LPSTSSIRLFDADPDLTRFLSAEDRSLARQVRLPLVELKPGDVDVSDVLRAHRSFAALVPGGMLLQSLRLGEHPGLRLIGPGDIVSLTDTPRSMLVLSTSCRATVPTRLALLGREFLIAARRWPWLMAGLHSRSAEQSERLATQLMICQLPRVDDRLLSVMWLLAESWGQVTASGTVLAVELTHSALGGLIGARRPTVTLALSELTERGAIIRQSDGWLLLEPPKAPQPAAGEAIGDPRLMSATAPVWKEEVAPSLDEQIAAEAATHEEVRLTVERLRAEHGERTQRMRARLDELSATRQQIASVRERIRKERPRVGRPAPS